MEEEVEIAEQETQVVTLETEVKGFADGLSYWAKYLAEKILSGNAITDTEINTAYSYLLEELTLTPTTTKPDIAINYNGGNSGNYKLDLLFSKLENVEGVNALTENQIIDFSPNATVVYGGNGSGKSGYVRLLKKVFYSKAPEEILKNIYLESGHKSVSAKFTFQSAGSNIALKFPDNAANEAFQQFSVFDGKSVLRHLDQRNEFEFRPAGLSFFSDFIDAVRNVEAKLNTGIGSKYLANDFADVYEGDSEIKTAVQNLSAQTDITNLKNQLPYSDTDKAEKLELERKYDDLLIASKGKEKEIKILENIKQLLSANKQQIENLNQYFISKYLSEIQTAITNCLTLEATAKAEGLENFKTDKIGAIGTTEWKNFIVAAEQFAKKQKTSNAVYPETGDNCLLCQQPLSSDAQNLITNYWAFIKSVAEQNAKQAIEQLGLVKDGFVKLNFDLFPTENSLTVWLTEKYPQILISLKQELSNQKSLATNIVSDIATKTANNRTEIKISVTNHDTIITGIDASIKTLRDDEQSVELDRLLKAKTKLAHKEKLELHIAKYESYVTNQKWISKAQGFNWTSFRTSITFTEKGLSTRYFNKRYSDKFNIECNELKGNFGISIDPRSSGAKSNRQLLIKGNYPSAILSEGEQKVIAIADFLSEMHVSDINRGIVFDDPVNSLDNDRKKLIALRLIKEAKIKQVIIFTHDLVFFYHLKNASKKYLAGMNNCFVHHSVEKENMLLSGKVNLNESPANEAQHQEPNKAEEWLAKSKAASGNEKIDFAMAGIGSLRKSFEAMAIFTIMGATVQRFDPQIRMGRLKDIKYNKSLIDTVVEKYGELSDIIDAHLQSDVVGIIPSPEILEQQIEDYKTIRDQLKNIR